MWYFWENDVIFSNSQPRLGTRKSNGGRKFSERKVKKTWVILFVIDCNLARYFRRTCCVRKCEKMGIENLIVVTLPCIRLARGKFELTNQDSAGGKNSSVLTSSWNQTTFVTGDGTKIICNFKNQASWQKVKNMNHFVFLSFYFGAKNGSPLLCMATRP